MTLSKWSLCALLIVIAGSFFRVAQAETTQPFITIEKPLIGTFYAVQSDVTISGTATPNSEITLSTKTEPDYANTVSDSKGAWSYTIPTVSEGTQTIQATVRLKIDSLSTKTASANVTFEVGSSTTQQPRSLAETGIFLVGSMLLGIFLIVVVILTFLDYQRHKKPLKQANPRVKYSFWHHLHVVSLPLLRYRLSINVDKRLPGKSERIRRY